MNANKKPFLCRIGLHDLVEMESGLRQANNRYYRYTLDRCKREGCGDHHAIYDEIKTVGIFRDPPTKSGPFKDAGF